MGRDSLWSSWRSVWDVCQFQMLARRRRSSSWRCADQLAWPWPAGVTRFEKPIEACSEPWSVREKSKVMTSPRHHLSLQCQEVQDVETLHLQDLLHQVPQGEGLAREQWKNLKVTPRLNLLWHPLHRGLHQHLRCLMVVMHHLGERTVKWKLSLREKEKAVALSDGVELKTPTRRPRTSWRAWRFGMIWIAIFLMFYHPNFLAGWCWGGAHWVPSSASTSCPRWATLWKLKT